MSSVKDGNATGIDGIVVTFRVRVGLPALKDQMTEYPTPEPRNPTGLKDHSGPVRLETVNDGSNSKTTSYVRASARTGVGTSTVNHREFIAKRAGRNALTP